MHSHLRDKNADLLAQINASGDFNDEIEAAMKAAIEDFKANGAY
jgi:F-type H+-transporting ATPase subunit alpha